MHLTLAAALVALPALVAAAPQPVARSRKIGYPIPITKRAGLVNAEKIVNLDALNSHITAVQAKVALGFANYEKNTGSPHPAAVKGIQRRATGADALTDSTYNGLWYGTISVGTPAKKFNVDFDTGSTILFLPGPNCTPGCSANTIYHPNASSTSHDLRENFGSTFQYGHTATGQYFADTVSVAGLTALNQTIALGSQYSDGFLASFLPAGGFMGMAFENISSYGTSVFWNFVDQGQTDKPVFSLKLADSGSELYLGGANSALYTGKFTYTPVTHEGYWQVNLDSVQGNGRTILTKIECIIDTGTTIIIGPPSDVAALHSALGGTNASSTTGFNTYSFPCDSFPNVSFTFGGTSFPISAASLNIGQVSSGSSDCVSGIVGHDGYLFWTVGDLFMRNVYTTFDFGNARVGFAQLA